MIEQLSLQFRLYSSKSLQVRDEVLSHFKSGLKWLKWLKPRGISLIRKIVRHFQNKKIWPSFDGYSLKTKGSLARVYGIFGVTWPSVKNVFVRHFAKVPLTVKNTSFYGELMLTAGAVAP